MGSNLICLLCLHKGDIWAQTCTQGEEARMKRKVETGMMHLQAKEHQRFPETTRNWDRDIDVSLPRRET